MNSTLWYAVPIAIIVIIVAIWYSTIHLKKSIGNAAVRDKRAGEIVIRGKVSSIDTGCFQDGICSMQVGKTKVIWGRGWDTRPRGQLMGINGDLEVSKYQNREVEVFGKDLGNIVEIIGDNKYYIKPL